VLSGHSQENPGAIEHDFYPAFIQTLVSPFFQAPDKLSSALPSRYRTFSDELIDDPDPVSTFPIIGA